MSISRRLLLAAIVLLAVFGQSSPVLAAEAKKADIVTLKSAYIVNFIRFTEWPKPPPGDEITLEIVGDDELYEVLRSFVRQDVAKAIGLSVDTCSTAQCLKSAEVVFLGRSAVGYESTLEQLKGLPVLTISDMPGFVEQGGMIEIKYQNNQLTFVVNRDAVARAGLYISAQLLQLGEVTGEVRGSDHE
ncbi:MAG TPA: YfiR family protein [Mariprofundaceae bacterium]|nr:YfiR family protein [Mariprofundaceae bacterium]